ncbi:MAG: hypothetical protein ABSE56_12880 [Bryobacteraceae bacterium]|jgi:hypothetical protein
MRRVLKKSNREPRPLKRALRHIRANVIAIGERLLLALFILDVVVIHVKAILGK